MHSTSRIFAIVIVGVSLLLLGACSANLPFKKKADSQEKDKAGQVSAGGEGSTENTLILIPNPFPPDDSATPNEARNEFVKVKAAMKAGRWSDAESRLIFMSETYPNLSGIYTNLGIVYLQMEKYLEAEKAVTFALGTNKHNFDAYSVLGVALREQGKFIEAEKNYLAALALWPHHNPSQRNLGILYDLYMGKLDKALVHYELSQKISGGYDKELKNWVIDLKRRIKSRAKKAAAAQS